MDDVHIFPVAVQDLFDDVVFVGALLIVFAGDAAGGVFLGVVSQCAGVAARRPGVRVRSGAIVRHIIRPFLRCANQGRDQCKLRCRQPFSFDPGTSIQRLGEKGVTVFSLQNASQTGHLGNLFVLSVDARGGCYKLQHSPVKLVCLSRRLCEGRQPLDDRLLKNRERIRLHLIVIVHVRCLSPFWQIWQNKSRNTQTNKVQPLFSLVCLIHLPPHGNQTTSLFILKLAMFDKEKLNQLPARRSVQISHLY